MNAAAAHSLGTMKGTLVDRLFALFWRVRLTDSELDAWYARSHASFTSSLETRMADVEHRLEWTDLHVEFQALIEARLEKHCLEVEGFATLHDALAAVEAEAAAGEQAKRLTFLLKSASDYSEFVRMMRAKARRREAQLRRARQRAVAAAKTEGGGSSKTGDDEPAKDDSSSKVAPRRGSSKTSSDAAAGGAAKVSEADANGGAAAASFFASTDGQW